MPAGSSAPCGKRSTTPFHPPELKLELVECWAHHFSPWCGICTSVTWPYPAPARPPDFAKGGAAGGHDKPRLGHPGRRMSQLRTGMLDRLHPRTGNILRQQLSFSGAEFVTVPHRRALKLICDKTRRKTVRQPYAENLLYFSRTHVKRLSRRRKAAWTFRRTAVRNADHALESTRSPVTKPSAPRSGFAWK